MSFAFFELFALLAVTSLVLQIWAIVDIVKTPSSVWENSDQNQIVWLLVVLFLSLIGPIIYLAVARPSLKRIRNTLGHS